MSCEHERHLVELAQKLADHYHERFKEADEHLQDLLEAIPGACQHVGVPRPSHFFPSNDGERYILSRPIRKGPRRELDKECFEAIQAYYEFRMIDMYRHLSIWLKAGNMLDRFRARLKECEHANKDA